MRASFAAVTAAITCGLLVLAGCGEESPEPKPLETASTSTTPSPSVSPAPSMPAEAEKRTKEGAIAFVRHFVEVMRAASHSGDVEAFKSLYVSSCSGCTAISDLIDDVYRSGGRIEGGGWTVTQAKTYAFDGDRYPVDVVVDTAPQTVHPGDGSTPSPFPGGKDRLHYFTLQWMDGSWFVYSLDPR